MISDPVDDLPFFPKAISVPGKSFLFNGQNVSLSLNSGLCVFVGPNGSGKSETLRGLRHQIRHAHLPPSNRKVVYLAAGRNSVLEIFRSVTGQSGPEYINPAPAAVGNRDWGNNWWQFESNVGMLLRLRDRSDLLLKLQARLQGLYQRRLRLDWTQTGLQLGFYSSTGGDLYYANVEASGILELVPLLAAIYDDEIGALLIDEPEISLHPQLQAFLLQEIEAFAGDPTSPSKKLIVLATHSPAMLPIRRIADIPRLVFFIDRQTAPVQIADNSNELKNSKLGSLIARLSENHKIAFFSRRVLLVEGPSDEIVINGLALTFNHPILGANTQVVPVTGKGQFSETVKFFRLMSKEVFILADLDALADDNQIVNIYRDAAQQAANKMGMGSVMEIDRSIRDKFQTLIDASFQSLLVTASEHRYWKARAGEDDLRAKRRATLAALLVTPDSDLKEILSGQLLELRRRYDALLELLATAGCVILRRGTIEDYYIKGRSNASGKPDSAAIEVDDFGSSSLQEIRSRFGEPLRAIEIAAPTKTIDENALLREQLGALLGAAFQIVKPDMPDDELNTRITSTYSYDARIFRFANRSDIRNGHPHRQIAIDITSPLFMRDQFPLLVSEHDNLTAIIDCVLRSD